MTTPNVFVSSTCYDLGEVRAELRAFIEGTGFHPLLSDHATFPISPDETALENCVRTVRESADIFVLLVGARRGAETDDGRTITNVEYDTAVELGLPIYVFIDKRIKIYYDVWRVDPNTAVPGVDDNRIFEFIDRLNSSGRRWLLEFEHGADICDQLRYQWAVLLRRLLKDRPAVAASPSVSSADSEPLPPTLRISLETPGWQLVVMADRLRAGLLELGPKRREHDLGLARSCGDFVAPDDVMSFVSEYANRFSHAVRNINAVFQQTGSGLVIDANTEVTIFEELADEVVTMYRDLLDQSADIRSTVVSDRFVHLLEILATFPNNALNEIEMFSADVNATADALIAWEESGHSTDPPTVNLALILTVNEVTSTQFSDELQRIASSDE